MSLRSSTSIILLWENAFTKFCLGIFTLGEMSLLSSASAIPLWRYVFEKFHFRSTRMLYKIASDQPRFANYMRLSLHIQYQFVTIHGVSRNSIDGTEFFGCIIRGQEGIQSGFIVSNFILLTLDAITVALIYNPTCGKYFLFDSYSREVTGNPASEGAAVLLTFDCIEDFSQYLLRLYPNIWFKITPVAFSDANVNRANTPSTDLNNSGTEKQKFLQTDENTYESTLHIDKSISRAVDMMLQVTVKQTFANVHQTIPHMPLPKALINTFRTITHMRLHLSTLKYIRITCQTGNCNFMASHTFQQEIHMLLTGKTNL